ncbi:response regulator transcription factor [Cohnella soli]|uniref:Response regulator n=1 Tax=Cohnella soli TaxID=425005 RepID=A0ABW0HV29_9BACL
MYNVWIVDDEPFILEGLASVIDWASLGAVIAGQAENGLDALEQIEGEASRIDILITDIAMPEMNGLELICELKKINPELKSIILSGFNEFDYVREGMRIGIENYLLKPINLEELTQTVISTTEKLNRGKIASLSTEQTDLLKDNILYRWVSGRIAKEQWKQRSDFLQLRLNETYSVVAVVVGGYDDDAEGEFGAPCLSFRDIDDNRVLIIGASNGSSTALNAVRSCLIKLQSRIAASSGTMPLIVLGSLEEGFEQAPASYRNAIVTLDYALLHPEERMLSYDLVARSAVMGRTPPYDPEVYNQLLLAMDEEALHARIVDDLATFSRTEGVTPAEIRSAAAELALQLRKRLRDARPNNTTPHARVDPLARLFGSTTLEQLIDHVRDIASEAVRDLASRQDQSPVIRQIVSFVQRSYMEEFSLKTLAQTYNVHPVYLGQLFNKEMNQTFSDYVNRTRIEKAMDMMMAGSLKTQDIAKAVGYWDTAHFYKHFKKVVGVSPAQYRKLV